MTKILGGCTFIDMVELRKPLRKTKEYTFLEKNVCVFGGRGA